MKKNVYRYVLILILIFSSGCAIKDSVKTQPDYASNFEDTEEEKESVQHESYFIIPKNSNMEFIASQLSKLDGNTYIVKKSSNFKALYNSASIKSLSDVEEFVKLHNYELNVRENKSYIILELTPNEIPYINTLKNSSTTIKGTLPLRVVLSELLSGKNVKYNFDKTISDELNKQINFYYTGDIKGALEHVAQQADLEIEFDSNGVYFQQYHTEFINIDLPFKDQSLATSIINNLSGRLIAAGNASTGSDSSSGSGNGNSSGNSDETKQTILEEYNRNILKEFTETLKSTLTKNGKFSYLPSSGQIMIRDKAENTADAVKIINNFNERFRDKIDIEFKFYKFTLKKNTLAGVNLAGLINGKFSNNFSPTLLSTSSFKTTFNDGTTQAVFSALEELGTTEIQNTINMYNQSNILNIEKVTDNFGYVRSVEVTPAVTTSPTGGVVSTPMYTLKAGTIPDGSFLAVIANSLGGHDIGLNYFMSFNSFINFMNRTAVDTYVYYSNGWNLLTSINNTKGCFVSDSAITSVIPATGTTGIVTNTKLIVTFNRNMNLASLNTNVTLNGVRTNLTSCTNTYVNGIYTYTCTLSSLTTKKIYTLGFNANITDANGLKMCASPTTSYSFTSK